MCTGYTDKPRADFFVKFKTDLPTKSLAFPCWRILPISSVLHNATLYVYVFELSMPPVMKTRPNGSHARWRRQNVRSTGVPFVLVASTRVAGFQGPLWFSLLPNPISGRKITT